MHVFVLLSILIFVLFLTHSRSRKNELNENFKALYAERLLKSNGGIWKSHQ
jgi:hypothetical protein